MRFTDLSEEKKEVARIMAQEDFYFFARYMFLVRRNFNWLQNWHHKAITDALDRVYRGEVKRLIINIPPRYSKCVISDTMVLSESGYRKAVDMNIGDTVLSHVDGRIASRKITGIETFDKRVVEVKSITGRTIKASYDHPMLTQRGWVNAEDLTDEHYLIRLNSEIDSDYEIDQDILTFVTMMLFEGGTSDKRGRNIRFSSEENEALLEFLKSCENLGIEVKKYDKDKYDYSLMGGANGVASNILREYGLIGCLAKDKRLPMQFFNLSMRDKYRFLSIMVATDGYVSKEHGYIGVTLASEGLIDDISLLLDSCGITSIKYSKPNDFSGAWELKITSYDALKLSSKLNCLHKQPILERAVLSKDRTRSPLFGYPHDVSKGLTYKCKMAKPKIDFKNGKGIISHDKFERMVNEIDSSLYAKWHKEDFVYDRVKEVSHVGIDSVIHFEVDGKSYDEKNYIANGYVVHNTELAVINWIAWCLGKNPQANFIHTSYSAMLAHKNSGETRELVKHEEFRNIFPDFELSQSSDAKNEWRTASGGGVYATGSGGSITGFGAGGFGDGFNGAIIIDDPHKPDEVFSDVIRQGVIDWFQNTLESRTNSPDTPIILIMQRLHEEDLAGWLENGGNGEEWEVLSIPVLDENENPLWPEKHSKEKLLQMRASNSYVFSSQYMQRPSPKGGDIIKSEWFRNYDVLPRLKRLAIFSDTASKTKEHNDYSVLLVAGLSHDGRLYILDVIRGKWEAPDLEQKMIDVWNKYRSMNAQAIFVEDKASGTSLIQNIQRKNAFPIKAVQVDKDKYTRVMGVTGYLESGYIHLPKEASWRFDFIDECERFTANDAHKHDDQVDSLVMAINELLSGEINLWDVWN